MGLKVKKDGVFVDVGGGGGGFDTSQIVRGDYMFAGTAATSLDLTGLDTKNMTSMSYMFYSAYKVTSLNLSSFDTSKVSNMSYMFSEALGLTSLNLSSFTINNNVNMQYMFGTSTAPKGFLVQDIDISNFDMSKVLSSTFVNYMFRNAKTTNLYVMDVASANKIIGGSSFPATINVWIGPKGGPTTYNYRPAT